MRRQGVMCRQWTMRRQAMCRHNASSGGNVSSVQGQRVRQCVVTMRRQGGRVSL